MKKLYRILNSLLWSCIGAFAGISLYTVYDYKAHPGFYALRSAPWYVDILRNAVFTAVIVFFLSTAMWIIRKTGRLSNGRKQ